MFKKIMVITTEQCTNNIELGAFWILIACLMVLALSAYKVFTNEEKGGKLNLENIALLWFWPIKPFYTSVGFNSVAKKWRPIYVGSAILSILIILLMFIGGYCA